MICICAHPKDWHGEPMTYDDMALRIKVIEDVHKLCSGLRCRCLIFQPALVQMDAAKWVEANQLKETKGKGRTS